MTRTRPAAVMLLSAGTLAFEILLVRAFAIEHFHHFAYMAIGVAMLGYGASGTLLAVIRWPGPERGDRWFRGAAVLTPLCLVASVTLVHRIPLDPTQLPWDPGQWPRLALVYLLLALPFGFGALAVLLAIALDRTHTGRTYGASFLGAGLGSVTALAVLWMLSPERALAVPALLAAPAAVLVVWRQSPVARLAGSATVLIAAAVLVRPAWRLQVTPYKGLPQVEAYPDARRLSEHASPLGWVVAVEAPSFRHAPGLSLAYDGLVPRQTALFVDGDLAGAVIDPAEDDEAHRTVLGWLPAAVPFALGGRNRVLVLGAGGGTEVAVALAHGARAVTAVELNPVIARFAAAALDSANTTRRVAGRVDWIVAEARTWASRSPERFDLISLGTGQAIGTTAAGVHALSEDFLHTADAYAAYLRHLDDDGVLAVTRWLSVPPRENLRVLLTAAEALRRNGSRAPDSALVVVRSWATVTTLVKPSGFSAADVARLVAWARTRRFDLDWIPGATSPEDGFNIIDEPVFFRAGAAVAAGPDAAARFAAAYPFDVAPTGDARPYPHHFLRWDSVTDFLAGGRGSWLPFAEWGYIALLGTLVQSVLLAALLILLPVAARGRRTGGPGLGRVVGYFGAIGFAYLAAEIAAIQQLNLLLGHPVYAVAAVLAAFLVFSGSGSMWSDLRSVSGRVLGFGLAGLLALFAVTLLPLVHGLEPTPLPVRAAVSMLMLAPLAFAMGMPFPVGLRMLVADEAGGRVAWAWAANGFASTVAAPLAALIALEAGSPLLLLAAGAAYAAAGLLCRPGT